jgi:hypothetical protein
MDPKLHEQPQTGLENAPTGSRFSPHSLDKKAEERNKIKYVHSEPLDYIKTLKAFETEHKSEHSNRVLLKAVRDHGDHKAREIGKKIENCRCWINWKDGEAHPYIRYCNDERFCGRCSRRARKVFRKQLYRVVSGLAGCSTSQWSLLTLTIDPKRVKNRSCRTTFEKIRKSISKLNNHPLWKDIVCGSFYSVELTRRAIDKSDDAHWNFHAHVIVKAMPGVSRTQLKKLALQLWNGKAINAGSIINIKKFRMSFRSILEMTAYIVKDFSLLPQDLAKAISVVAGRRLRGATGSIRTTLAAERKRKGDDVVIPPPPRNDGATLKDGRYTYQQLLGLVINHLDLGAMYSIKLIKYRSRWGYSYEETMIDVER